MSSIRTLFFVLLATCSHAFCEEQLVICRDLKMDFDLQRLSDEIALVADEYVPRRLNSDYWTAIPLRNATGTSSQVGVDLVHTLKNHEMLPCTDTVYLEELPYIASILDEIRATFDTEVGLVRLSKVPSGKTIPRHRDAIDFDIYKGAICRLHIPILTGQDVIFEIADNHYNLEAGKLYYTNVYNLHSVVNSGTSDRVHIIIDVHSTERLRDYIFQMSEVAPR